MATSQVVPTEAEVPVRMLNEKLPEKAGFTVKDFTGKFPDPELPGKQIEAGYWAYVPSTKETLTSFGETAGKNGKPLQDKNFAELTGVYKLAFDAAVNVVRRSAVEQITALLDGPAVKIEKAVARLQKIYPNKSIEKIRVLAMALSEEPDDVVEVPAVK